MTTRELPPEEWERLDRSGLPALLRHVDPADAAVVVVEDEDRVIASLAVLRVVHMEGLWIDPEHRNAGVGRSLTRAAVDAARRWTDAGWVFAGAADGDGRMQGILERLGGAKLAMDTYALSLGGR